MWAPNATRAAVAAGGAAMTQGDGGTPRDTRCGRAGVASERGVRATEAARGDGRACSIKRLGNAAQVARKRERKLRASTTLSRSGRECVDSRVDAFFFFFFCIFWSRAPRRHKIMHSAGLRHRRKGSSSHASLASHASTG